ncbi:MAG: gephyrin-like molybdotransferase Glp [bacterium]
MIPICEAIDMVLGAVEPMPGETVPITEASGRTLALAVAADFDVPAFANSQMDGFAIRAADIAQASDATPVFLPLGETLGAGSMNEAALPPGTVFGIMTGAAMPEGADAVVPIEDVVERGSEVGFRALPKLGAFVRLAGEDMRSGEEVLGAGHLLRPADIGLLASLGHAEVRCQRRPRVAILGTGNELVALGTPLRRGHIHDSNAYTLAAAVQAVGAEAHPLGIVRDTREDLVRAFASAAEFDFVLSTGGVSVGQFDYVKEVMDEIGLVRRFWRVAQKPGKPLTFAVRGREALYFGLPGNPVSAMVCFELYVAPALRRALRQQAVHLPSALVEVGETISTSTVMTELVRCRIATHGPVPSVVRTGTQSSGALRSLSLAECLVISPPGCERLKMGSEAQALLLRATGACVPTHPFGSA